VCVPVSRLLRAAAVQNDRVTRDFRRLTAVAAAALLTTALVSACGGGDDPDAAESQPPPTGLTPSESPSGPASEVADQEPYLPVPEGVELTPPGSELAVGDSAVVAWEPRQDLVGVLDVTVTRLLETTFAESFQGWQLSAETRATAPYFVRATVTNAGESELGGRDVPLYAVDASDALIQASSFQTKFEPCPGNGVLPKRFRPGASRDVCLVYLVPGGGDLTAISFRPDQEFDPITWTGPIEKLRKDQPKKQNRRPRRP
jgi:hypothetical protein